MSSHFVLRLSLFLGLQCEDGDPGDGTDYILLKRQLGVCNWIHSPCTSPLRPYCKQEFLSFFGLRCYIVIDDRFHHTSLHVVRLTHPNTHKNYRRNKKINKRHYL